MWRIAFSQTFHIKVWRSTFSADLRKPCWITGECLSSTEQNILFFEKIEPSSALKILQNRMRNIHVRVYRHVYFWFNPHVQWEFWVQEVMTSSTVFGQPSSVGCSKTLTSWSPECSFSSFPTSVGLDIWTLLLLLDLHVHRPVHYIWWIGSVCEPMLCSQS